MTGVTKRTIPVFIRRAAERWAERTFLIGPPPVSYAACAEEVARAAGALRELGVGRGDRVLIMLPNGPEFLYACWGANTLGAIAVPANPAYREAELAYVLGHAEPSVAVVAAEFLPILRAAAGRAGAPRAVLVADEAPEKQGEEIERRREGGSEEEYEGAAIDKGSGLQALPFGEARRGARPSGPVDLAEEDIAVFIYTSGTTGWPKAAMQTHRTYVLTGESFTWWLGLGERERLWTCLPLYHINAQAYSTMGAVGGGHALALRPTFSASRFWDDIRQSGATQFNAIGAMIHILLKQPARPDDAENPVRLCYAALALPREQHLAFERRFNLRMVVGYGLSECTFGTIWPSDEPPRYGTIGKARQHPTLGQINQVRVVGEAGQDVPPGEVGEVWLRNPAVMAGYFRDEAQTRAVLADGWLRTGDLATRDADGWLTFVGRKGDLIRRRGENISASEIEACLGEHPGVQECAAVAVPSELGEEEIKVYVVPVAGAGLRPEDVVSWCAERLAPFKVPRFVEFRASLPRTHTQRVAKHLLRGEQAQTGFYGWDRLAAEASSPSP